MPDKELNLSEEEMEKSEVEMEELSDDNLDNDYYGSDCDKDVEGFDQQATDPEHFEVTYLTDTKVERLFNKTVDQLSNAIQVTPWLAKVLLHLLGWNVPAIVSRYQTNSEELLMSCKIKPDSSISSLTFSSSSSSSIAESLDCVICFEPLSKEQFSHLPCNHFFCNNCWHVYFKGMIDSGISIGIKCMATNCDILAPDDFIFKQLSSPILRRKFQQLSYTKYIQSHPELRFCPGLNCNVVVRAKECEAKRVVCNNCKTRFCFMCGSDYHIPTSCKIFKKWLKKCADDSETANYICANTKDCPKCHICIEKNGGCNHVTCSGCKFEFCWMCLGPWKKHAALYECSRYVTNEPNSSAENAREALRKYLHYYERWENHSKSLKLEEETLAKIRRRIEEKVMTNVGTWIDWYYLIDAANLLARCRFTLQNTYPYAYYLESNSYKNLFEYQQGQLEVEIENLSMKIERAEITDRGDLENQMDIVEKRRITLLTECIRA